MQKGEILLPADLRYHPPHLQGKYQAEPILSDTEYIAHSLAQNMVATAETAVMLHQGLYCVL